VCDSGRRKCQLRSVLTRQHVLPGLQRFSLVTLQSVTGLSNGACSLIRRGRVVPHPRHWQPLQQLTSSQPNASKLASRSASESTKRDLD
jgi:hypothetical protein